MTGNDRNKMETMNENRRSLSYHRFCFCDSQHGTEHSHLGTTHMYPPVSFLQREDPLETIGKLGLLRTTSSSQRRFDKCEPNEYQEFPGWKVRTYRFFSLLKAALSCFPISCVTFGKMSDFPKGGDVQATRAWLDLKGFQGVFENWEADALLGKPDEFIRRNFPSSEKG